MVEGIFLVGGVGVWGVYDKGRSSEYLIRFKPMFSEMTCLFQPEDDVLNEFSRDPHEGENKLTNTAKGWDGQKEFIGKFVTSRKMKKNLKKIKNKT